MWVRATSRWAAGLLVLFAGLTSTAHVVAAESMVIRLSEPVEISDSFEVFGEPMPDKQAGVSPAAAVAQLGEANSGQVRVTTPVERVCQKKGCFFIARDGDIVVRVTFADYSFFVPTDIAGRTATLVGTLTRTPISQAQADHYAEDMGVAPKPLVDAFEYVIEATSVLVERG